MSTLILGLSFFLGIHSTHIFTDGWRMRQIARLGENGWKGLHALISLAHLWLIGVAPFA